MVVWFDVNNDRLSPVGFRFVGIESVWILLEVIPFKFCTGGVTGSTNEGESGSFSIIDCFSADACELLIDNCLILLISGISVDAVS